MEKTVYFGDEEGYFHAVDIETGKARWVKQTGAEILSSPNCLADGVLVGSYDANLYNFDPKTGEIKWRYETEDRVHCSPAVGGGRTFVTGCDGKLRIIDVATGSADIPLAICRWAARTGRQVRITAVDANPTTLELAREHVDDRAEIELVHADALQLMDQFTPRQFDYAHAGMFLHHLNDIQVITVLRIMDRLTRRGLIWNDLIRGRLERLVVRLLVVGQPEIVRHDAIASVAAGFTRKEALDLARRVGLGGIAYHRHLFGRFTLTSEKG